MKALRILGHPVTVLILFSVILISGQSIGNIYLFYILLALPEGHSHALLTIAGTVLLMIGLTVRKQYKALSFFLNILAIVSLSLSLYFFFNNDTQEYNYGSFNTIVFWITFGLFGLSGLLLLINTSPVEKDK